MEVETGWVWTNVDGLILILLAINVWFTVLLTIAVGIAFTTDLDERLGQRKKRKKDNDAAK